MNPIVLQAIASPVAAALTGAPAALAPDKEFSSLLGEMAHAKPAPKPDDSPTKSKHDSPQTPPSAQSILQSLEAALNGLAPPRAAAPAATTPPPANDGPSPLRAALAAAVAALDKGAGGASVGAGQAPLKALLQSDPSLGLSDFQVKTFLAVAGATPARAGATALAPDTAWTPLAAAGKSDAAAAKETVAPTQSPAPPPPLTLPADDRLVRAAPSAAFAFSRSGEVMPAPRADGIATSAASESKPVAGAAKAGAAQAPSARLSQAEAARVEPTRAVAASTSKEAADGDPRRNEQSTPAPAAPPVVVAAAPADVASTPSLTVAFSNLPTFIADQAMTLAEPTPQAGAGAGETAAPPKAAQSVKELQISLDPADLGQMTLKLRLAGGKLSVSIGVANPQTLAAIEGDRALIAARLATGEAGLEDLVIQRQAAGAQTTETSQAHGFGNESGSPASSSQDDPEPERGSDRWPRAAAHRGARGDGTFGDSLV